MIFGTDTSVYQEIGTYDPGAFEIINVGDPQLERKAVRNTEDGRPTGLYVYLSEYGSGGSAVQALLGGASAIGHTPELGFWFDYEGDFVTEEMLTEAFGVADGHGIVSGRYGSEDKHLNEVFKDRPYWIAQYPGKNGGNFPGFDKLETTAAPVLWQFSSTGGTLDVNVVVNEDWYYHTINPEGNVLNDSDKEWLNQTILAAVVAGVDSTLNVLIGDHSVNENRGVLAEWEWETRNRVEAVPRKTVDLIKEETK